MQKTQLVRFIDFYIAEALLSLNTVVLGLASAAAIIWMQKFVNWYNTEHLHSGINFVTPESKHNGADVEILKNRNEIYEAAKIKNPSRWSGKTRNWDPVTTVKLNTLKEKNKSITTEKLQQAC